MDSKEEGMGFDEEEPRALDQKGKWSRVEKGQKKKRLPRCFAPRNDWFN